MYFYTISAEVGIEHHMRCDLQGRSYTTSHQQHVLHTYTSQPYDSARPISPIPAVCLTAAGRPFPT